MKKHRHKRISEIVENPFAYKILGKKPKMVKLYFCQCGRVADKNKKIL